MNCRLMIYKNQTLENFWNADFINEQLRLIDIIKYAFKESLVDVRELKLEEINQIFDWIS